MAILESDFVGGERDYCTAVRDFKRQLPLDVDRAAVEIHYGPELVRHSTVHAIPYASASASAPH
jgi:hypothetical protein